MMAPSTPRRRQWLPILATAMCCVAILYCIISYISGFYVTGEMIIKLLGSLQAAFMLQRLDVLMPVVGAVCGVTGVASAGDDRRLRVLGLLGAALCVVLLFVYFWILIVVIGPTD